MFEIIVVCAVIILLGICAVMGACTVCVICLMLNAREYGKSKENARDSPENNANKPEFTQEEVIEIKKRQRALQNFFDYNGDPLPKPDEDLITDKVKK